MRGYLFLALLLAVGPVGAQQVYKCKGGNGSPVYQSHPCENAAPEKTWDARRYEISPERRAQINRERREAENAAVVRSYAAGGSTGYSAPRGQSQSQSKHQRCEAAKRHRDRQVEALGLKRTYEDLQRLDKPVYQACK